MLPLLRRYLLLSAPDDLPARAAATECAGHVIEALGPNAAASLLPPFIEAAIQGFSIDSSQLKDYGHGLLSLAARVLEARFAPFLARATQVAFESVEAVRARPLRLLEHGASRTE